MLMKQISPALFPVDPSIIQALGIEKKQFPAEITSFDGRPFLIPSEFALISSGPKTSEEESPLNCESVPLKSNSKPSNSKLENRTSRSKKGDIKKKVSTKEQRPKLKDLETIVKKVRTEESLSHSASSTQCEESNSSIQSSLEDKEKQMLDSNIECKQILMVNFEENRQELMYTVKCLLPDKKSTHIVMTRREVINKDPKLLLYFYENHIEFTKTPNFAPKTLKSL